MKTLPALILSMSILTSCDSSTQSVAPLSLSSSHTLTDLSYGADSAQRMDVYLPAGRSVQATKSLVLIHGGGWNGGSKTDFASHIAAFRKRMPHYAIFNLEYRLATNGTVFPAQENDIRAALDFIAGGAPRFGINPQQLVLVGASAGGHLALLQAYKYGSPRIAAVIDFFGPTDLLAMYEHPWHPLVPIALQMITGTTPAANRELYRRSSPLAFVTGSAPPTLILHGGQDPVVDISQSRSLAARLNSLGVPHELVVYPGERHGWYGRTLDRSFDAIETFLRTRLP
jgi:acetyl esterase/lipase